MTGRLHRPSTGLKQYALHFGGQKHILETWDACMHELSRRSHLFLGSNFLFVLFVGLIACDACLTVDGSHWMWLRTAIWMRRAMGNLKCWMALRVNGGFDRRSCGVTSE